MDGNSIPLDLREWASAFLYIFLPLFLGLIHGQITDKPKLHLILHYYLFISVGIQGLITGFVQIFFPKWVEFYSGMSKSLALRELGLSNLSFGILGILSPWQSRGWKYAAASGYGIFLLATGLLHLKDLYFKGTDVSNFGGYLFSDLLDPLIFFSLIALATLRKKDLE